MQQRPAESPTPFDPPDTGTMTFLLVPRLVGATRNGRGRLVVSGIAAPTPYGWRDEHDWWGYQFELGDKAVYGRPTGASLHSVWLGDRSKMTRWRALETAGATWQPDANVGDPDADVIAAAGYMGAEKGERTLELYVDDLPALQALLHRAARKGGGVEMQVTPQPAAKTGLDGVRVVTALVARRSLSSRGVTPGKIRARLRREYQALALTLAERDAPDLPPLLNAEAWQLSEVHKAAREIALRLGAAACAGGWPVEQLRRRLHDAIEFVLRARAGGLGAPCDPDRSEPSDAKKASVLVPRELPAALVAQGKDPLKDDRASAAYYVALHSHVAGNLLGDAAAVSRLREVPDLVTEYLGMRWFRYAPLSAALARALVAKEATLFLDEVMRRPAGVLDGSLAGLGTESWAYRLSSNGRRPVVLGFVRFAQSAVPRLLSTAALLAILVAFDVSHAGWIAAAWLLFAKRIRALLFGPPEPSRLEKNVQLSHEMMTALGALTGRTVPVAVYRHALLTASERGVAWDAAAWELLADSERKGEAVWRATPGRYP